MSLDMGYKHIAELRIHEFLLIARSVSLELVR